MNNKNFMRKMLSVIVASIAMTSLVLTGCGSSDASTASASENKQVDAEGNQKDVITIWSYWTNGDLYKDQGDWEYWKAIEEACNVDLEFVDSSGGKDALSLLAGTDDLPDIIIDYDFTFPGGVQKMLLDGSIISLNDLMDNGHLPNFKAYLDSDAEVNRLCTNNEGLYAWTPMIRKPDSPLVFNGNMIRQDWLDELGLKMPETIQEMEDVLVAFKDKKGCNAALSFIYGNYSLMVNSFGIREGMYVDGDNKVHFGAIEDEYLDFLTLFNRWMNMGILDPDAFTQDADAFFAKIASSQTGLVWGYTGGTLGKIETMKAEHPEMNYQPLSNPVQNKGDKFIVDQSSFRVNNIGGVISSTCSNPEAAARVLDYTYSEEGNMLANYGKEGVTYEMVDGKPVFTDFVLHNSDGLSIEKALSIYAGCNNKPFLVEKDYMLGGYVYD
ncbi:MAG: extracellular solute-binding protein, partial [Clostridium sp.]|nr:extracellular solute-binding protein [Clostridium sp.]